MAEVSNVSFTNFWFIQVVSSSFHIISSYSPFKTPSSSIKFIQCFQVLCNKHLYMMIGVFVSLLLVLEGVQE